MLLKIVIFGEVFTENFMGKTRVGWIIHIFAALHAAVALLCRLGGAEDELLLTILTMAMTLLICVRKAFSAEFAAASVIVVNIVGYLLGSIGAIMLSHVISVPLITPALSTALTTEILGWSIVVFSKMLYQSKRAERATSSKSLKWILLASGAVFAIRVGILFLVSTNLFQSETILQSVSHFFSNSISVITLICLNIIYVRYSSGFNKALSGFWSIVVLVCFMILAAFIGAGLGCIGLSFDITIGSWQEFLRIYIVALISQVTIYCIVFMVNYTISAGDRMQKEKEKKHIAQYRYQKLKRQVNPHFLFNSLNALDCLVWEEKPEQASTYIHKLAGIYRYMIKSEDEDLVQLSEELTFVGMYVDLLKVRFPEGFDVQIDVRNSDLSRHVLPCSIQLLIENATKHNAVGAINPLIVRVTSDGSQVTVANKLIPKVTKVQSTGLGQKYIRQQYLDLSGKEILIEKTCEEYRVTLPLL